MSERPFYYRLPPAKDIDRVYSREYSGIVVRFAGAADLLKDVLASGGTADPDA